MLEYFQTSPVFFIGTVTVLGLLVGSFLNVVIYRLPLIVEREWQDECSRINGEATAGQAEPPLGLIRPGSRCPHCGHRIGVLENIPVLSYLWLKGRCSECRTPISPRYPLIELITALLSAIVAWHFGFGLQAACALLLTWALIPLSMIDYDHQILPDAITLPFLWLGLTLSLYPVFADSHASIIGAMAGYLSLWAVYQLFRILTGKEGMGYGDFKLLAMLGAWMGWQALAVIVLLSTVVGAFFGILLMVLKGRDHQQPIPFGPYLAAAGWIALLWGEDITGSYLRWAGLSGL